ncbi:MAG: hypothetical protein ACU833_02905 [Gammaproteobacteria bacterium]
MIKKVEIHLDALAVIFLVFAVSFGFNLYQREKSRDLFQDYMDMHWKAQNMEANWKYLQGKLERCRQDKDAH